MGDTLITVVAILLAAILMFVFPLMSVSERGDDVSQLAVQTAVNKFVDNSATSGKITIENYNAVSKSYPGFFKDYFEIGGKGEFLNE